MKLLLAGMLPLLLAAPANAQPFNFGGDWQAPFTIGDGGMKVEEVTIRQIGNTILATKRTGDAYVPAGTTNLRGIYTANRFGAEQICAAIGFRYLEWEKVFVTILDADHFKVEGGCSGGAVWTRDRRPKLS